MNWVPPWLALALVFTLTTSSAAEIVTMCFPGPVHEWTVKVAGANTG